MECWTEFKTTFRQCAMMKKNTDVFPCGCRKYSVCKKVIELKRDCRPSSCPSVQPKKKFLLIANECLLHMLYQLACNTESIRWANDTYTCVCVPLRTKRVSCCRVALTVHAAISSCGHDWFLFLTIFPFCYVAMFSWDNIGTPLSRWCWAQVGNKRNPSEKLNCWRQANWPTN